MDFQAELRVYQPLEAFPDAVQTACQRARHRSREATETEALRRSRRRLLRPVTDPFPHGQDLIRVLERPAEGSDPSSPGGSSPVSHYFCPDEMALRSELAVEQLAESVRPQLMDLVVPEAAREANLRRLADRATAHGGPLDPESEPSADPETDGHIDRKMGDAGRVRQVQTRTAVWGVPVGWFSLFAGEDATTGPDPDDETTVLGDPAAPDTVRRVTPLDLAVERARRAAVVLSLHAPDMDLLTDVTALVAWLESFHPRSFVELDYGGLARHVWPDESATDVAEALAALEEADLTAAAAAHHRLVRRWLPVRQLGRAS